MSITVASIEERIEAIKKAIEQSLANHNALLGMLSLANDFLNIATKVADTVAPGSVPAAVLTSVDNGVNALSEKSSSNEDSSS